MVDLIRWDPFREIDRFFEETPLLLPALKLPEVPVDLYETDKEVVVEVGVPKMRPEDIKVTVEADLLKIEGKREEEKEEKNKNYYRKEIKSGSFARVVRLPAEVRGEEAKAKLTDGVLKVTLMKVEPQKVEERGRQIKVE